MTTSATTTFDTSASHSIRTVRRLFVVTAIVLLAMAGAAWGLLQTRAVSLHEVGMGREIDRRSQRALALASERHAALLSYWFTGDSSALIADRLTRLQLTAVLDSLSRATMAEPDQRRRVETAQRALGAWERDFAVPVSAPASPHLGRRGAALADVGRARFDDVRRALGAVVDAESAAYPNPLQRGTLYRRLTVTGIAVMVGLLLVALLALHRAVMSQARRLVEQQEQLAQRVSESAGLAARLEQSNRELLAAASAAHEASAALGASEERYRLASRSTEDLIWDWDIAADEVSLSDAVSRVFGYQDAAVVPLSWWHAHVHPDDWSRVEQSLMRALTEGADRWSMEYRLRRADGAYTEVQSRGYVVRNNEGAPVRMVGSLGDVSERARLEAQLRQAQKMEAVGQLAGGVAHDFNNILTTIKSYAQLLLSDIPAGDSRHADMQEITRAADRAASLTRQLLAFSRRQLLQPRVLDVNDAVRDVERMLQHLLLGELRVELQLDHALGRVEADPGQLEQVLLNLLLNARDAMPDGGTVLVRTRNAERPVGVSPHALTPARYVVVEVQDRGGGMDAATRARIFEPFFTTKPQGKGTGLGLSTAYGIVKQSGGYILVESEPGLGSLFSVYLPRVDKALGTARVASPADVGLAGRTILVVDDEEPVRSVIARVLSRHGYRVLQAEGGRAALRLCEEHGAGIALVVSDLTMPEMSGEELMQQLHTLRPALPVLLTSGYTANSQVRDAMSHGVPFLQKPFTPAEVLQKVAEALEGAAR